MLPAQPESRAIQRYVAASDADLECCAGITIRKPSDQEREAVVHCVGKEWQEDENKCGVYQTLSESCVRPKPQSRERLEK